LYRRFFLNNFCPQPWVGLDISPQGHIKPCCKYSEAISENVDEYFLSPALHELKQQFLNNQKPPGCKRCWDDENAGLQSKRQLDLEHNLNFDTTSLNRIKLLSLPFGNTCNLACRTCGSYSSSKWTKDETSLKTKLPDIKIHSHKKFYKNKDFIAQIQNLSANLSSIQFPGGESFITGVSEQLDYLDFLIKNNSEKISLTYITNCTTFPSQDFWDRWQNFNKVNIQLSIDGIEEKFEYLRYPADWVTVHNNIKKYQLKQNQLSNLQLSISHTVSVFNVYYIGDFLNWCITQGLPAPYLGMVEYPIQFNIRTLPKFIKNEIAKKLSLDLLQNVKNYMHVDIDHNFEHTLDWINMVDSIRNQRFTEIFPEMGDLLIKNKY
jgi:sulfatase maturation enzyme AslB (radical SAM superfamily)